MAIFALGPDCHDRKAMPFPPMASSGIDYSPSFECRLRTFLFDESLQAPNRTAFWSIVDPLPDSVFSAKHDRSQLFLIVRWYLGERIGCVKLHHVVDELVQSLFLPINRQVPVT